MKQETWIPIEQCEDGYLYIISARNARLGIFHKEERGFVISRFKFGHNSLFVEYHWDTGEPYGTVQPFEKVEKAPEEMWAKLKAGEHSLMFDRNDEVQAFLNGKMLELKDRIIAVAYQGYSEKLMKSIMKDSVWTEEGWTRKDRVNKMSEIIVINSDRK
jgi:hypothetical protein